MILNFTHLEIEKKYVNILKTKPILNVQVETGQVQLELIYCSNEAWGQSASVVGGWSAQPLNIN